MNAFEKSLLVVAAVAATAIGAAVPTLASDAQKELFAENFMEADADADGALTLSEFTALIDLNAEDNLGRARVVQRMGRQETAFERIDADGDGLVTPEEISELAARAQQ